MSARVCVRCRTAYLCSKGNSRYCSDACRFLAKVRRTSQCWEWTATLDRHGYGTFYLGRNARAHRAAYELFVGPIPGGLELDHLCRNRSCVNPDHLEPVDRRTNILRGDAPTAQAYRAGRCQNGHTRTRENTYYYQTRRQQCRTCAQASRAKREGKAA